MAFRPKVKIFIQNTLFFTLGALLTIGFFSDRGYTGSDFVGYTDAGHIAQLNTTSIALGMNLALRAYLVDTTPVNLNQDVLAVSAIISNAESQKLNFVTQNMKFGDEYRNLLSIDIPSLLDQSNDRAMSLDAHINLLRHTHEQTNDRLDALSRQRSEFKERIDEIVNKGKLSRDAILSAYENTDTNTIQSSIDTYVATKRDEAEARTYMTFIERFMNTYTSLQTMNEKLIDALTLNRETLIKGATVTIPKNTNTTILQTLDLLQNENK